MKGFVRGVVCPSSKGHIAIYGDSTIIEHVFLKALSNTQSEVLSRDVGRPDGLYIFVLGIIFSG